MNCVSRQPYPKVLFIFSLSQRKISCARSYVPHKKKLYAAASQIMEKHNNKDGVAEGLKLVYREYDKNNFLYQSDSADFTFLTNNISDQQLPKNSTVEQ